MVARRTNRVAPAPAPLREPRQQRLVRQRFENQRQAPKVGQLPKKRVWIVLSPWEPHSVAGLLLAMLPVATPPGFFARRGRSPQGAASGRRALGWNLRKLQSRRSGFAVFRARVKEILRP